MFHGTKDEQKALTQELRDLALSARGLGSRLELLLPHMAHSEDYLQLHETAQLADNIAQKLAGLYPLAVKRLEAPSEPR